MANVKPKPHNQPPARQHAPRPKPLSPKGTKPPSPQAERTPKKPKEPQPPAPPARYYYTTSSGPESPPIVERTHYRRKRWGLCHPGIAIPVVAILTLLLRVHPCIVCAILLLNPYGSTKSESSWVLIYGPWVLFLQSVILIFAVILMFTAVWKEAPVLLIPYIIIQILALGVWLLLTIYAVVVHDNTAIGLIIISGIGAIFDLWSMITTIAAYMDIRGYIRGYEIEAAKVKPMPQPAPVPSKPRTNEDHISDMWRNMDTRPRPKLYQVPKSREDVNQPQKAIPSHKTRYAPDSTSEDMPYPPPRPPRPSRKPRLDSVKER